MNLLFLIYFVGILIALFQDFKRREVDVWLNLLILFSGFAYLLFNYESFQIIQFAFLLLIVAGISFAFYYSRFFAGGDACLLFAITPLFVAKDFYQSLLYLGIFLIAMIFSGAVYGLCYLLSVSAINYKKIKTQFFSNLNKIYFKWAFAIALVSLVVGYFNHIFLVLSLFIFFFILLFSLAGVLEKKVFTKQISTQNLKEGDLIVGSFFIGKKKFEYNWEGISSEEAKFLNRFDKKVTIKEGLPFVPAFLIALIIFYFKNYFIF
jgi:hypothetical protein